jgi:putative SOS response-associated peptidase YedK
MLGAQIHARMPVIFPEQYHAAWFGETGRRKFESLAGPLPCGSDANVEISPRVNSQKNDDPSLWEFLHSQPAHTTTDTLELLRE